VNHPELQAEQAYIDHAYERVDELRAAARAAMEDVLDLGKGGTFQARTERDVVVRTSLARLDQLDIGTQPLTFGRIDEVQGQAYYIGRMGVSGRDQEPLVVDWRAPVAEPFYRATGRFPMGLARRRHFELQGRELVGIEDEPLVLGDNESDIVVTGQGALLASLERARSGRMQDIVATIQGEQDEVIRSELPGVLVVQGGPGTGKTAVALHRAAYLLYTYRFPLERQGVLVVGPNPIFLRYIGHVLPSLGESGVTLSTVSGLVHEARTRGSESNAIATIKGDFRMSKVIARAVRNRERPLKSDVPIGYGPYQLVISAKASAEIVATIRRRGGSHNNRRKRIERMVGEHLYAQYTRGVERARLRESNVRDANMDDFIHSLRDFPAVAEALDRMWPRLQAWELIHDLFGARPLIELATNDILTDDEARLLHRSRSLVPEDIPWTDADMALIDEARVLLGPVRPLADEEQLIPTFGHVVVDEAQDLSPMQLRMLGRRSLGGSMTLVGDIAQATGPWAPQTWQDVLGYLPKQWPVRQVELTIGYRTPAQAMELATNVLKRMNLRLTPPTPVRSSETAPVFWRTESSELAKEALLRIQAEQATVGAGTVGVIVPRSLLDTIIEEMEHAHMTYGARDSGALESDVTVLPADIAKGLEFDSVIVVEPKLIVEESNQGLRALYVSLTRTINRLTLVFTGDLPDYLELPPPTL
jgi:DNA helicase IV